MVQDSTFSLQTSEWLSRHEAAAHPDFSAAAQEEAVSHLHDVGLVHRGHLSSVVVHCILEGVLCHSRAGHSCDHLQVHAIVADHWVTMTPSALVWVVGEETP